MKVRFYQKTAKPRGFLLVRGRSAEELNDEIDRFGHVLVHEGYNLPHVTNLVKRSDQIRNPKPKSHPNGKPLVTAMYTHITPTYYYVIHGFCSFLDGRFSALTLTDYHRKRLHEAGLLQYEYMPDYMRRHMGVNPQEALTHY